MQLAGISPGDVVLSKGGRHIYGEIVGVGQGSVYLRALRRGVSWRHASARKVIGHWRRAARSVSSDLDP